MPGIVDLRNWNSLFVNGTTFSELRQEIGQSILTEGAVSALARLETLRVENCTVDLEGSDDGQTFVTLVSTSNEDAVASVYLNLSANYGTTNRLYKYLRWRLVRSSAADFHATFRIRVILTGADGSRRPVRTAGRCGSRREIRSSSGLIHYQPLTTLIGKGTAADIEYPIQPIGQWLDTTGMPGYHVKAFVAYANNAVATLESNPYPEEYADSAYWVSLRSLATAGTTQFTVSNETDEVTEYGGGYLRWRVVPATPADPWEITFSIDIVPAVAVEGRYVQPRMR